MLLVAAAAAGAAAPPGAAGAPARGVLRGVVVRGPVTPVCRAGVPCDEPAAGVVLTFTRPGLARSVRTGAGGVYRIALPPGRYAVATSSRPFGRVPSPASVRVRAGRTLHVDFAVDTGIR